MDPNFTEMIVDLVADIYPRTAQLGSTSDNRLDRSKALYHQRFRCRDIEFSPFEDSRKVLGAWAEDGASRASHSIESGLACVNGLLVRSLSQSSETAANLGDGKFVNVAGIHGRLIETSEMGTLIYVSAAATWIYSKGVTPTAD